MIIQLQTLAEEKYGSETYSGVHHYETLEVKTGQQVDGNHRHRVRRRSSC